MNVSVHKLFAGQILLILCCALYLVWWSVSYRPGISVSRVSGFRGLLLMITALCGVTGMVLSVAGANHLPGSSARKLSGTFILISGVVLYFIMMLITTIVFHRIVTTELFLITGWGALELMAVSALNGAGIFQNGAFLGMAAVIAAAWILSMVLYVLYYRMEAHRAFYAAMVPLIAEAASMLILIIVLLFNIRNSAQ